MKRICHPALLTIFLLLLGLNQPLKAQVPQSPSNFSHWSRHWIDTFNDLYYEGSLDRVAMGKDRFVSFAASDQAYPNSRLIVLDSSFNLAFARSPSPGLQPSRPFTAISAAREVWYVLGYQNDCYVSILSEQGTLLSEFMLPGIRPNAVFADTLGKIFLFANAGPSSFDMIRFSNASTIDFANTYPIGTTSQVVEYGNDGRFYVPTSSGMLSIDRNGNPLRLQTHARLGTRAQVFKDHGHAMVQMGPGLTVEICKTDSNMVVQWAQRVTISPPNTLDSTISLVNHLVLPHSREIMVAATVQNNLYHLISCNHISNQQYIRVLGFREDGTLSSRNIILSTVNKTVYTGALTNSPFGEALLLGMNQHCIFGAATARSVSVQQLGLEGSPECGGSPMTGMTISPLSIPNGSSTVAAITPTPLSVSILPATIPLTAPYHPVPGGGSCAPPCARLYGFTPLGGGQVQFHDSLYGFHAVQYNFGDGNTGTVADPIHTYLGPGTYSVRLIATNECGSDTAQILVDPCQNASLNAPLGGCVGLAATFSQATNYPGDSIEWLVNGLSYGPGNAFTFTPPAIGNYQIGIIYHNHPCSDTTYQTFVVPGVGPFPAFSFAYGSNNTVYFTNQSTLATSYVWDFGDATASTATNPSHVYATSGTYTVCLTATNACGTDDTCMTISCTFPQAAFGVSLSGPTVTLQDQSIGANSIAWSFGDGNTGTGASVTHTYANSGTYTICQYVTGNCGVDTLCQTISAVANTGIFFRIAYSALGVATPRAHATNGNGQSCVVGNCTSGEFMLVVDSTGAVQSLQYLPSSSYLLNDVCTTPSGDFLIVGGSTDAGPSLMNGFWLLLSPSGTILDKQVIGTTSAERYVDVKRARYGGYILSGTMNTNNGFYSKLGANMQLEWSKSSSEPAFAGFQVADSSYWMVQWRQSAWRFIHLNPSGVAVSDYSLAASNGLLSMGFEVTEADAVMDCNGKIYVTAPVSEYATTPLGSVYNQGIYSFDTQSLTGTSKTIAHSVNGASLNPTYEFFPADLGIKPDGNLVSVGTFYPRGNPNSGHLREQFLTTFTPGLMGTDSKTGTTGSQDRLASVSIMPNGTILTAGDVDGTLILRKFLLASHCAVTSFSNAGPASNAPINTVVSNSPLPNTTAGTPAVPNPIPIPLAGSGTLQCFTPCNGAAVQAGFTASLSGNTLTLTSTSTPGAYLFWNVPAMTCAFPGNQVSFPVTCGPYPLSLVASNGCRTDTFAMVYTVPGLINNPSYVSTLLNDTAYCLPGPVTFTAPSGYLSYQWSTGSTAASTVATPPASLSLIAQTSNGCFVTDTVTLSMATINAPNLGSNQGLCPGASLTLNAGPNYPAYAWSTGATTQTISVSAAGTYMVTVTNNGGCTAADTIVLSALTAPVVNLGPNVTVCPGAVVPLDAGSGFSSYNWSNGATSQTISPSNPGTYSVTVTGVNGCTGSDAIVVGNFAAVNVSLGPDVTVCPGTAVPLNAGSFPGFNSYNWSNGATSQTISPSSPGTYSVTVTTSNGCTGSDAIVVGNFPAATVNLGPDVTVCPGTAVPLNAGSGFSSYSWSSGATSQTISPSSPGTYSVTVTTSNGCTGSDVIVIGNFPAASVNLGPDVTVCPGTAVPLNPGSGFNSYSWSNGATSQTISPSSPGAYSVTVTTSNGCTGSDVIVIGNFPAASVNLGPDVIVCPGTVVPLNAGAGFSSYSWSNGATSQTISPSNPGAYSVTVTNSNGCAGNDAVQILHHLVPPLTVSSDTAFCDGGSAVLTASGAFSGYVWSTTATTASITATATGTYSVTATDVNGCTVNGTVNVTVFSLPTVNLGPDTNITAGSNMSINAGSGFAQYQWSTGGTGSSILVSVAGTYWVQVTDGNGCVARDTIVVGVLNHTDRILETFDLRLSPIPAAHTLRIEVISWMEDDYQLEAVDMHGKILWTSRFEGEPHRIVQLDVSQFASGYYLLRVIGNEGMVIKRFGVVR